MQVQWPSSSHRQPHWWASQAAENAGASISPDATSAAFNVGVTTIIRRPCAASAAFVPIDELIAKHCPDGVEFRQLGAITKIASARVSGAELDEASYVGVDNLLPNFGGRKDSGYGINSSGAIKFGPGDILVGNIRPYLKKVWLADREGGASPDVLTITPLPGSDLFVAPRFLYYLLASDAFIDHSMRHAKGAKMPRGDKVATIKYRLPVPPLVVQHEVIRILDELTKLEAKLEAELVAELGLRARQYAFHRDKLVTSVDDTPTAIVRDVVDFFNAKAHEKLVDPTGTVALTRIRG